MHNLSGSLRSSTSLPKAYCLNHCSTIINFLPHSCTLHAYAIGTWNVATGAHSAQQSRLVRTTATLTIRQGSAGKWHRGYERHPPTQQATRRHFTTTHMYAPCTRETTVPLARIGGGGLNSVDKGMETGERKGTRHAEDR